MTFPPEMEYKLDREAYSMLKRLGRTEALVCCKIYRGEYLDLIERSPTMPKNIDIMHEQIHYWDEVYSRIKNWPEQPDEISDNQQSKSTNA